MQVHFNYDIQNYPLPDTTVTGDAAVKGEIEGHYYP